MGIVKCTGCGCFMNDDETVWVDVDDTHQVPYCVSCGPDQTDTFSDYEE